MNHWMNAQYQTVKLVFSRFKQQLSSTFLIALVIGIALSLPSIFYVTVDHISQQADALKANNEISLFVALDANDAAVSNIKRTLDQHPEVLSHRFVPKAEAWAAMKTKMQLGDDETGLLSTNPLPHAFHVQGKLSDSQSLEGLRNDLAQIPQIDQALVNTDWASQLDTIAGAIKRVILGVSLLLAIGLLVIIGNTIRMQILTQRDEIEVSYLIGATKQFIRAPFLYAGLFYGAIGGIIGMIIVAFSILLLNRYLGDLSSLYGLDFSVSNIGFKQILVMLLVGVAIGWSGAYFAVNRTISSMITAYNQKA